MRLEMRTPTSVRTVHGTALGCVLAALAVLTPSVEAQSFRGWISTNVQSVGLRPLVLDTLALSELTPDANGRLTFRGAPVSCTRAGVCTLYSAGEAETTVAATQDVHLTAWGLGVQGLSVTTSLRGRARSGGELVWPRSDDRFDLLLGYAQLDRGKVRVRVGRQEVRSGLGFPAFDGGWASVRLGQWDIQAYGGRSLARGLREPANEVLKGLEDFYPDYSAELYGAAVSARFPGASATARYHRELYSDNSGLIGERASLDVVSGVPGARLTGSLDYDFSFERLGKARLTVAVPMAQGKMLVEVSGRRYVPYFDLSTIWGYFEPVSYSEAELRASFSPTGSFGAWASTGRRSYSETGATTVFRPLRDHGWRAASGIRWQMAESAVLDGSYRLEWGPGAFLSSGDVALRLRGNDDLSVTLQGMTFQQIEEFVLGDGRAYGGGISLDWRVTDRASLGGGASVIRHRDGGTPALSPWNQSRAWTSLRIAVGEDPGLAQRRGGR